MMISVIGRLMGFWLGCFFISARLAGNVKGVKERGGARSFNCAAVLTSIFGGLRVEVEED